MFYKFVNLVLRLLFFVATHLRIEGRENVPGSGSLMVAMNHLSFLDSLAMGVAIPRRLRWLSKVENLDKPILGALLTLYGVFPVQRGEVDRAALSFAIGVLRGNGALAISPEGTRSKVGRLARAKTGAAWLAIQSDPTILPVAITGTEQAVLLWPKLHRPEITVRIGRPFRLQAKRPISQERRQELADEIMMHVAELLPESYRGFYGSQPADSTGPSAA
jgi:1-acyl-sn-glycerol-3-phosphate acyltransferase